MNLDSVAFPPGISAGLAVSRGVPGGGKLFSRLNHHGSLSARLCYRNVPSATRRWAHWSSDRHTRICDSKQLGSRGSAVGEAMEPVAQTVSQIPAVASDDGQVSVDVNLESSGVVPPEVAANLVEHALVWASLHGLVMGDRELPNSGKVPGLGIIHAPLSLLPAPITKTAFEEAVELAPLFNTLVDRVAADGDFLQDVHAKVRLADDFTDRLLDIHSRVMNEGVKQSFALGLHRSDYMLDMPTGRLLQVEINTISSSFAGLGSRVSSLHNALVSQLADKSSLESSRVPENKADYGYAEALVLAWEAYGHTSAAVLIVVQPEEWNMYDQQWLAFRLYDSHGVRSIRRTLAQVFQQARIDDDGTLLIEEQAVSVVYYRAGYVPTDYPSEAEWGARLLMERSNAIKCPTISYHLAGTKKVQQELARPGVVERYLSNADAKKVRTCFAGLWGLDEGAEEIIEKAIAEPDKFVLKPQREGGENNLFGDEVRAKLLELKNTDGGKGLAAYILMQRILPPVHMTYLVRRGAWDKYETVSEVGIYGTYLRCHGDRELLNRQTGHLVRSKVSTSYEGGVVAGYGVLDSPYLVD